MKKEKIIELWQEKMLGDISAENEHLLAQLLNEDNELAGELKALERTWNLFEEIDRPEPTEAMDARFADMMSAYSSSKRTQPSFLTKVLAQITNSWQLVLAALFIGCFIGLWLLPSQNQQEDIQSLSAEIQSMKEMMLLTLIEQPKAQERIKAVNLASELREADKQIINALITTLNNDENVNVRLASLESLIRYTDQPEVRQALVNALGHQDSALLQVAISDVLVDIQEKSSIKSMESLKNRVKNKMVKEKLEQSIEALKQS